MLKAGSVVIAALGKDEEGKQRSHYGSLMEGELYRVSAIINGNDGQPLKVRLAGESGYWLASFFAELAEEEVEKMQAKVAEATAMGAKMHPKLRKALVTA